jgi:Zn-dependent M28 family amino/carboxypeptidase
MKKLFVALLSLFALSGAAAQTILPRDPAIAGAIDKISVENMHRTVEDLVSFHNRNNMSDKTDPEKGIGAAANYLYDRLSALVPASEGRLSVERVFYKVGGEGERIPQETELCNIVATIEGSDPADSRVIIASAHYDNRGADGADGTSFVPGANDDGSGVAALLEMARLLPALAPRATVKLMFLSGEEHGLYGAKHAAEVARAEGWNIVALLNNDMIGNSNASETDTHDNTVLRVFSENIPAAETESERRARIYNSGENDSRSRQVARYIKETGERYVDNMTVRLIYRNDRFGRGGDHTPFNALGFPSVRLTEVNENYFRTHTAVEERDGILYGDCIEGIDFEYLRKNTGVNLATVANLALAPAAPENVHLDASGLENSTSISWTAPVSADGSAPAAYYLLVRETDASQWQKKIVVHGTEIRVPYSKDNYFFGVQSVDGAGHESIAVFVTAGR